MLTYQTPNFMTDLLQKVQVLQIAVAKLNDGHSLHVDLNSNESYPYNGEYHISFDATLFADQEIEGSWDFNGQDDAELLQHTLEDMTFKINRL